MFKGIAKAIVAGTLAAAKGITKIDKKINTPTGLTIKRMNAVFATRGVADMLHYRRFQILSEKEKAGVYEMADGRRGFILQITPPPYLGSNSQKRFRHFIASLAQEGNVIHISTYASKNVSKEIGRWKELHHCNSSIPNEFGKTVSARVGDPSVLQDWVENRASAYTKWTTQSMMRYVDVRLRNFITTVAVLAPYGASDAELIDMYRTSIQGLSSFSPECFYPEELMSMYSEIFKPNAETWEVPYDDNILLNQQIGLNTKINVTDHDRETGMLTIDDTMKMQTLTTVKMPKHLGMAQFQQLFFDIFGDDIRIPLPSSYFVSMTIAAKDIEKIAEKAVNKALSDQNMLRKLGIKDIAKNPQFGDRYNESVETVNAIKEKGERLFNTMFQIFVFENDEAKLDRSCKALIERFKLSDNGGWILEKERHPVVSLNTMLYSLPLMYLDFMREHHLKHRFFLRWTSNNAATAPIVADAKGFGDFMNIVPGRTGQLIRIDWKAASNQNIIIIGPMGVGKSFFINEMLMSAATSGVLVRAFDLGGSAKSVCLNAKARHIEFDLESGICMNFFTNIIEIEQEFRNPDTGLIEMGKIIHPEEYSTIVPMIGLMCKQDLKSSYNEYADDSLIRQELSIYVQRALETAHRRRQTDAGMREVYEALHEIQLEEKKNNRNVSNINSLITGLYNYGHINGMYFKYFNGTNNIDISDYDFAIFEFEKLKNMGDLLYVAQAGIMQRIAAEFFYLPREIPKMFGVDEAKIMALDNKIMISYLEDFSLRLRKYGAVFYLATQDSQHFENSDPKARSMFSLAAWKVFFERDESAIEKDIKTGILSLGAFEKRIMASIKHSPPDYSEFCLVRGNYSMVCRLKVDTFSYWLFTTNAAEMGKISDAENKYGLSRVGAITYLSKIDDGVAPDVALEIAIKRSCRDQAIVIGEKVT